MQRPAAGEEVISKHGEDPPEMAGCRRLKGIAVPQQAPVLCRQMNIEQTEDVPDQAVVEANKDF